MAFILESFLEDRKMPEKIKEISFNLAKNEKVEIYIPAIVFAYELAYLSEKNRINTNLTEAEIF